MKLFKRKCPKDILTKLNGDGLTFEEKVTILLWGDDDLGIDGLRGRVQRNSKYVLIVMVMQVVTITLLLSTDVEISEVANAVLKSIAVFVGGG